MRKTWNVVLSAVVVLGFVACGDDGASVRSSGTASGSGSGSATGAASGSGSGTGAASGEAGCTPFGEGRIADAELDDVLDEWSVSPEAATTAAGTVEFQITNVGEDEHEFAVTKGDSIEDLPLADDDTVDIPLLEEQGEFVGEVEAFPSGEDCTGTFDLEPGRYVLFCNLVHEEEDGVENHFQEGMATEFVVEASS